MRRTGEQPAIGHQDGSEKIKASEKVRRGAGKQARPGRIVPGQNLLDTYVQRISRFTYGAERVPP